MLEEEIHSIENLSNYINKSVTLRGWVQNKRDSKSLSFIVLRDGSGLCQCIVDGNQVGHETFEKTKKLTQESSIKIVGKVVADERQIGGHEIHVSTLEIISIAGEYPISKKEHGVEFLMENRHLWLRSNLQWATMRIRSEVIFSLHQFFREQGFVQMDSPIFTGNACEGTTTLFSTEYYGATAFLSQSGQLYGEAMAMAMGKIYTFGPTFRAEKSKTRRHLSEFWMVEPEMAFYDNDKNMDLIEEMIRFVVLNVLKNKTLELQLLKRNTALLEQVRKPFIRLSYDEAIDVLKGKTAIDGRNALDTLADDMEKYLERMKEIDEEVEEKEKQMASGQIKKKQRNYLTNQLDTLKVEKKELQEKCKNIPQWIDSAKNFEYGNDLGGSDETVISRLFNTPVMIYNWPHEIKAFYMKRTDDKKFAKGVDVLAPEGYGEIVGGGERETDEQLLRTKIKEENLSMDDFSWYLDLRKYGNVPHAGFGLGLERFVAWICKSPHLREAIPFPRMYGHLKP